eukprot:TRINITY_DN1939_c0_g2_i1.p1 TRINITY_DN1939_c0_g2~~TRINITY_DN1939_c0_g2_i1.p1  ORF type:complete len:283 (-),score=54.89 TRINITY_DN1939_c0_g2_i1:319-1167(-)
MSSPGCNPSPSHRPSPSRLWRPAAQRNVRNSWSKIVGAIASWSAASSKALSLATSIVNSHLNLSYMHAKDLGVLKDMDGIRDKACAKLLRQQEEDLHKLITAYRELVDSVVQIFNASKSMRTYVKGSINSPILEFCSYPNIENDFGDGGGTAIYSSLPLHIFENLGEEIADMFISELKVKRILVLEFEAIVHNNQQDTRNVWNWKDDVYAGEIEILNSMSSALKLDHSEADIQNNIEDVKGQKTREMLQVYLTAWLAEVNINKSRIEEIKALVGDEMQVTLV